MMRISKATTASAALLMGVSALQRTETQSPRANSRHVTRREHRGRTTRDVTTAVPDSTTARHRTRTQRSRSATRKSSSRRSCSRAATTAPAETPSAPRTLTTTKASAREVTTSRNVTRRPTILSKDDSSSTSSDDVATTKTSDDKQDEVKDKNALLARLPTALRNATGAARLASQIYGMAKDPNQLMEAAQKQTRAVTNRVATMALDNEYVKQVYGDDENVDLEESKESLSDYLYGGVYGFGAMIRGIITPVALAGAPVLFFGLIDEIQSGQVLTTGLGRLLIFLAIMFAAICFGYCKCAREERMMERQYHENKDSEFDNTRCGAKCCFERCTVGRDLLANVCFEKCLFVCFGLKSERKNDSFMGPWVVGLVLGMCAFIYFYCSPDMLLHPLHVGQQGFQHVAPAVEAQQYGM